MRINLEQLQAATAGGTLAHEVTKMEQERASWRDALAQSVSAARQFKELTQVGSAWSQISKDVEHVRSATSLIGQQYKELMATTLPATQAIKAWQESQSAQQAHVRKMLEPLADIRKSFMLDDGTTQLFKVTAWS